ncbi:MAG: haloacid dehalogenase type II [Gammaproteobacteria bacterium]|nr:haloacid dehalogenase type II [Gammaproteobacteria bacterium]
MNPDSIDAVVFDVFGTVVDWRTSVIREGRELGRRKRIDADWEALADAWRDRYQPSMEKVRSGKRPWTKLDDLHRESLLELLDQFGITGLEEDEIDYFNRAWHRLDPWPDSVEGLTRLKQRYVIATLSNGNIALLLNMAKRAGLPWDAILGAEPARAYKPTPKSYLRTAEFLGLPTKRIMLCAAHNDDLMAARSHGYRTAFVRRPTEYGPKQTKDLEAEHDFDVIGESIIEVAEKLGC